MRLLCSIISTLFLWASRKISQVVDGIRVKERAMPGWDPETRRRSRILLREITRRADPEQDWWVSRDVVERELGMERDALLAAAELLVKQGRVERGSSDFIDLRPTQRRSRPW
jgi:hypothetical protein